jgi:D-serine deaminase-like pyridoxal phosphate-dependent protein
VPALAQQLAKMPGLIFEGVSLFPGHIRRIDEDGAKQLNALGCLISEILDDLERVGLKAKVVSGGNTPTAYHSHLVPGLNEIRSGTYVFNDRNTEECGGCAIEDCAASVLVTVVSTAVAGQAIVDGGSKAFAADPYQGAEPSFGHVLEAPEAHFTRMSEEHGFIDISRVQNRLSIGQRLRVIPNHICPAINLHENVYAVRGNDVVDVWNVKGRGKLQ